MHRLPAFLLVALIACASGMSGCGGGTGGGPAAGDEEPPTPAGPDVAVLFVNGHSWDTVPSYLVLDAAPFVLSALEAAGYTVESYHFTDDLEGGDPGGYSELVDRLGRIHTDWIAGQAEPTRIVVIAHSHGGVRAHAAIRATPQVPVRLLVDLDASSNGWTLVHPGEGASMGGEPQDAYTIPVTITCPDYPGVSSQDGFGYDVEDVVFDNVAEAFEVRTGAIVVNPFEFEEYDERWNARLDGGTDGLTCYYSDSDHSEPILSFGTTLPIVRDWILARLAVD